MRERAASCAAGERLRSNPQRHKCCSRHRASRWWPGDTDLGPETREDDIFAPSGLDGFAEFLEVPRVIELRSIRAGRERYRAIGPDVAAKRLGFHRREHGRYVELLSRLWRGGDVVDQRGTVRAGDAKSI